MKKNTLILVVPIVLWSIVFSCKKPITTEEINALRIEYDSLNAAVDTAWHRMIGQDDEKIFYMKRLLQEVSFTYDYDSLVYAGLMNRVAELKKSRYSQESMIDGSLIDQYDNLTAEVITEVSRFASNHPKFENYPLMGELINEIMEMDGNVLVFRVEYDSAAFEFNQFLVKYAADIDKIVPGGAPGKKALFAIIDNPS